MRETNKKPKKPVWQDLFAKRQHVFDAVVAVVIILLVGGGSLWLAGTLKHPAKKPPQSVPISFHFTPPTGWTEVKPTPKGTMASYAAPSPESDSTGKLKPFIVAQSSILQSSNASKLSSKQITNAYIQQLSSSYGNYHEISTTAVMLDKQPATLINFTSQQDQAELTIDSLFFVKGTVIYSVNGESLSSTWAQHADEIKQSLLSFRT